MVPDTFSSKLKNIRSFLESSYFEKIPYINISAGIWAAYRTELQCGPLRTNLQRQKNDLRGFMYDIEHASVFAPYCDAMITEKKLAKYLNTWFKEPESIYKFKVYSTTNKQSCLDFLNEIKRSMAQEMEDELEIAYGNNQ